jgi:hypothetical protein
MIAEIPDPQCSTVQEGGHAQQIASVRSSFIACFGAPPSGSGLKKFAGKMIATLTGVGFFDHVHTPPQTGVAPNGIELHPLLGVKTTSGKCPTGNSAHAATAAPR